MGKRKLFTTQEKIKILKLFEELPDDLTVAQKHIRIEKELGLTFSNKTLYSFRCQRDSLLSEENSENIQGKQYVIDLQY